MSSLMGQPHVWGEHDFTTREREVFALMSQGVRAKAAGIKLGISYRTVESHVMHMMHKAGARRFTDLVRIVLSER